MWLEPFESLFVHRAQLGGLRRYVEGLLCDSRRKSMAAMWARVRDPGAYQALQYFLTDAVCSAETLWRQLRAVLPVRSGILILDGTGFPKQVDASVGVSRLELLGAETGKVAVPTRTIVERLDVVSHSSDREVSALVDLLLDPLLL